MIPSVCTTASQSVPSPAVACFRRHGFGIWLALFYASWLTLMFMGGFWGTARSHWPVAVAMAGGAITAGSTPVAGGTVGFPVLVYVFSRSARLGCDFSLAIQSVGMVSASLFMLTRGRLIDWRMLKFALIGTAVGTPLGSVAVAPFVADATVKSMFAILYASFGLLHLTRMRQLVARSGPSPVCYRVDPLFAVLIGLAGGVLASVIGVGADMLLYGMLVLLYRADIRIAIPTAVIQMAGTSLLGLGTRVILSTLSAPTGSQLSEMFPYWLTAAPVVVVGGPIGTIVSRHISRQVLLTLVSLVCVGQYCWTCSQQQFTVSQIVWATVAVFAVSIALQLIFLRGQRALGEHLQPQSINGTAVTHFTAAKSFWQSQRWPGSKVFFRNAWQLPAPLKVSLAVVGWLSTISFLHLWLNLGAFDSKQTSQSQQGPKFNVGFLPVTCHLTCPVTHFINETSTGNGIFKPMRFNSWPELKEAFLSGHLQATFILAPMAMALREQGVPLKIVYLGHRDGTTMMVRQDSDIYRIEDLRGKKIAVPNRFSNQRLIVYRALKERGMSVRDVTLLELSPPDMPAALQVRAVDAIISGEPFMAQTEMDGYGRVLFLTKDVWPEFISCVLAVKEETIRDHRAEVQRLVDGISRSGRWLDQTMDHRMQAAEFTGKNYYSQDPKLLRFVLSKPPDRVKYTNLAIRRKDFEEIEVLGLEAEILQGTARFEDYADPSFVPDDRSVPPYAFEVQP